MLRRSAVFLGAFASLALSGPGAPVPRALKVGADVDLDEDGLDVGVDLSLGSETYPEEPPPQETYPETPDP